MNPFKNIKHTTFISLAITAFLNAIFLTTDLRSEPLYQLEKVFESKKVIWSFHFTSQNEMILTEKNSNLVLFDLPKKKKINLQSPEYTSIGQGGLLDVHFRKIKNTNFIYLTFSERFENTITTSLARGVLKNQKIFNMKTLFRAKVKGTSGLHFGSRLAFNENYIFMTIGDRGQRDLAQDLSFHNGKILRLHLDGTSPTDNPFFHLKHALPEIWSYGHRNPQGIDFDPLTGELFSAEFGPRGGDELNVIEKGKNYGWPITTYGREYYGPKIGATHKEGMEQPITYWSPSISPSGIVFYHGNQIQEWSNNLFLANLGSQHIRRLVIQNRKVVHQESLFENMKERFRHVQNGPDGFLYASTDSGKIFKIRRLKHEDSNSSMASCNSKT